MRLHPASPRGAPPRRPRGFTLVELMVAVTILGVLMLVAVPSFQDAMLSNKLSGMSTSFSAGVQTTKGEAIKRNATVKMCRSADGANCAASGGWEQGWIVFNDTDDDGVLDAAETLVLRQTELPKGFLLTGDNYNIQFRGTGLAVASATLKLCRNIPSVGGQDRAINVNVAGRVNITTTATGTCAA